MYHLTQRYSTSFYTNSGNNHGCIGIVVNVEQRGGVTAMENDVMQKILNTEKFGLYQCIQIFTGLREGLDVELYAKPEFTSQL